MDTLVDDTIIVIMGEIPDLRPFSLTCGRFYALYSTTPDAIFWQKRNKVAKCAAAITPKLAALCAKIPLVCRRASCNDLLDMEENVIVCEGSQLLAAASSDDINICEKFLGRYKGNLTRYDYNGVISTIIDHPTTIEFIFRSGRADAKLVALLICYPQSDVVLKFAIHYASNEDIRYAVGESIARNFTDIIKMYVHCIPTQLLKEARKSIGDIKNDATDFIDSL